MSTKRKALRYGMKKQEQTLLSKKGGIATSMKLLRSVLAVVLAAALLSTMFKFLLPAVSSGFVIIISAVASATMGAALFPLRFEDEEEEA